MEFFHMLQTKFLNLQAILLIIFVIIMPPLIFCASNLPNFPIAKPNCTDRCGDISIPYPFGTTENCYHNSSFWVTCNTTFNPPKLFLHNTSIDITYTSLDGQFKILSFIARTCFDPVTNVISSTNRPRLWLPTIYTFNNTANRFIVVGCNSTGFIQGMQFSRNYTTGCIAMCYRNDDVAEESCAGVGCCQSYIPENVRTSNLILQSSSSEYSECTYGFLVEKSAFNLSLQTRTNLRNAKVLPMVVDWAIGNGTCEEAQNDTSTTYACKSPHSECYKPNNGYGYRCRCNQGYQGNPYLEDSCKDIDECRDPTLHGCEQICLNTPGGFKCQCPIGYTGDGIKGSKGCTRGGESIRRESIVYKLASGIVVAIILVMLIICWLYIEHKRRKSSKTKQKFFLQNGGILLQEKLTSREKSSDTAVIFSSSELIMATNNFHTSMIIGQGGYGVVYKGCLTDKRIVAIKKSKEVDPNQIDQFINEVIVLSQINHRNVVKLLGCCLETQAPLLVYEFISNGTLFEYIHSMPRTHSFDWKMRLKIATETAGVLSYLHSAASTPIIHRDVKSANILLDHTFTVKVADFGASRLVPIDQTQLSTMVQGTFGYLDPEYMQTNQLTEKSDVYSFGVVLVELLTGRKALSYDKPEEERNLANFFLSILKQELLFRVLDDDIVWGGNREQIVEVARLAKGCLNVRGEDRPTMKEVAMELEGLRLGGKHSWEQTEHNEEKIEMESLLGEGVNGLDTSDYVSIGYDSLKNHVIFPTSGAR